MCVLLFIAASTAAPTVPATESKFAKLPCGPYKHLKTSLVCYYWKEAVAETLNAFAVNATQFMPSFVIICTANAGEAEYVAWIS